MVHSALCDGKSFSAVHLPSCTRSSIQVTLAKMRTKLKWAVHEEVFWRTRLDTAFRTAWGCFMAGLVLQLGNMHVQWTTFPIFSYVMAVLIVGESTFGKALQDTAGVLTGTIQGVGMAILVLQLLKPERMTEEIAVLCIALSSFIIVYPQNMHILAKRVALAHSAILYSNAAVKKGDMERVYFPLRLAGTTIVGAICGMLALLLPFPRLAIFQVRSQAKLSTRIISERLRVTVDAFCINETMKRSSLSLQAKALAKIGSTVDAEISAKENDMDWEFPGCAGNLKHLIKGLIFLQKDLKGMELALRSDSGSESKTLLHSVLNDSLIYLTDWTCLALRHAVADKRNSSGHRQLIIDEGNEALSSFNEELSFVKQKLAYMTVGEIGESMRIFHGDVLGAGGLACDAEMVGASFQSQVADLFFLFYIKKIAEETKDILSGSENQTLPKKLDHSGDFESFLADGSKTSYSQLCDNVQIHIHSAPQGYAVSQPSKACKYCNDMPILLHQQEEQRNSKPKQLWFRMKSLIVGFKVDLQQFITAFKMSLAMSLGAFVGTWFSRKKGYWADITLALGFTGVTKGGWFKIANLRAQGTVAGSIYGLLVVLAVKDFSFLRMVALIPWVVLTSFLRQSKFYGYAGAVSAFTGAIVLLARTDKDSTDQDFTVVRIVEAFLGMATFITVEMLVLPRRAASIVKNEFIVGLGSLKDFTAVALSAYSGPRCQNCCTTAVLDLKKKEILLRNSLSRQNALVKEASEEPQFWFTPFPATIFSNLMEAQARMLDLLHFSLCSFETILKLCENAHVPIDILHGYFRPAIQILEEKIIPTLKFLEQTLQVKMHGRVPQEHVKELIQKSLDGDSPLSGSRFVELENLVKLETTAPATGISQQSFVEMAANRSKQFMEEFEKSFLGMVGELVHCIDGFPREPHIDTVSNTVLLSHGALAFSLQGLLEETSELEKIVHELLQLENPWSLIDLWDVYKPMKDSQK